MTHTYFTTQIDSKLEEQNIHDILKKIPNVSHVHFSDDPRHVSLTLNSYITIEKINKALASAGSPFQLVKQIKVHPDYTEESETTGKIYKELGLVLMALLVITIAYGSFRGLESLNSLLRTYVGVMLIVFGFLKLMKFLDFAESHQRYDIISKHFVLYAYLYPFLELTLGFMLILNQHLVLTYIFLSLILFFRVLSVFYSIALSEGVEYAYLDGTLKIRVSYATTLIDALVIGFCIFQLSLLLKGLI